jgi:hypothetical protein
MDNNLISLQPKEKNTFFDSFSNQLDNSLQNVSKVSYDALQNKVKYATPDVDQYRFQKNFNPETFNPYDPNNQERWTNAETWSSAIAKGFDGFKTRFGNTFVDYWRDYGRMGDALINWDMTKMMPSELEMIKQHNKDQQEMIRNKVFVSPGQEDSLFSKSSISEFISNSGFALGTTAAFSLEILADAAITALSSGAGAGTFWAIFGKVGAKTAIKEGAEIGGKKIIKEAVETGAKKSFFTNFVEGVAFKSTDDILRAGNKAGFVDPLAAYHGADYGKNIFKGMINEGFEVLSFNAKNIINSKSFGELVLNVGKGIPVLGSGVRAGEKMVVAGKAGYGFATHLGIGINGLKRMANEYNMASTEAAFESISTYGEGLDQAMKRFQATNGRPPTGEEFKLLQLNSSQAAFANYKTNMAVLLASNKIQFGALVNKMPVHLSWLKKSLSEGAEDIITTGTKQGAKIYSTKGFAGGIKAVAGIAKDAGKRKAVWEGLKLFRKDFLKFEVVEGLQEILQESSNVAWRDYYENQFYDDSYAFEEALGKGLGEQWSPQGLKVFVHGALTGSMIRIPTKIMSGVMDISQKGIYDMQYGKENNPMRQYEKQQQEDIALVNSIMADYKMSSPSKLAELFKDSIKMNDAVNDNDAYAWNNARDNIMIKGVIAANRLGVDEAYISAIRHMADEMSTEEFNKTYGIDLSRTTYKSPKEFLDSIAKDIQGYSENVTKLRTHFQDKLINPEMYTKGSSGQYVAGIVRKKQEEALSLIALNALKGNRNIERVQKLKDEISKISGLETSSQYGFRVLTSVGGIQAELGEIEASLLSISESIALEDTQEGKKEYIKKRELLLERQQDLNNWLTLWNENEEFVGKVIKQTQDEKGEVTEVEIDSQHPEILALFRKIMNSKNKEEGLSEISEEAFQESGVKLIDIIKLTQDTRELTEAYQSLNDPIQYSKLIKHMTEGHVKFIILNSLNALKIQYLTSYFENNYDTADKQRLNEGFEELNKAIMNLPIYKSLMLKVSDAQKTLEDLDSFREELDDLGRQIETLYQEWSSKKGYDVNNDDLSEDDINSLKEDKTISDKAIAQIARKLTSGIKLEPNEASAYTIESIKKKVDKSVEEIKVLNIPESKVDNKAAEVEQNVTEPTIITPTIQEENDIEPSKTNIEKEILGLFSNTTERIVKSKGPNNGRNIKTELINKISSDGEVIVYKSKSTFTDNGESVITSSISITIEEFKEHFYSMLTADEIEMFEDTLQIYKEEGWNGKLYFKELRIGSTKATNLKGQINLEIMIGPGNNYGFTLTKKLNDTELVALESSEKQIDSETVKQETTTPEIIEIEESLEDKNYKWATDLVANETNELFELNISSDIMLASLLQYMNKNYANKDWSSVMKDGRSKKAINNFISKLKNQPVETEIEITPNLPNIQGSTTDVNKTEPNAVVEVLNVANDLQSFIEEYSQKTIVNSEKNTIFAIEKFKDLLKNTKC